MFQVLMNTEDLDDATNPNINVHKVTDVTICNQ